MDDRTRLVLLLVLAAVLVTLPFLRTTDTFYTSDANVYYHTADLMFSEQRFTTQDRHKGWIVLNGTYRPAMPIGYSLLALPVAAATDAAERSVGRIERDRGVARAPADLFGKAYWLDTNASFVATLDGSHEGEVISFFAQVRSLTGEHELVASINGDRIVSETISDSWTKIGVHAPATSGTNRITFAAPDGCTRISAAFPFLQDDRCFAFVMQKMFIQVKDPAEPDITARSDPLILGTDTVPGGAIINWNLYNISRRLAFTAWSYDDARELTVQVVNGSGEDAMRDNATVLASERYTIPAEGREIITPELPLIPANNTVRFRSNGTCAETFDAGCATVGIRTIEILPDEAFRTDTLRYTGSWYQEELSGNRWMATTAGIDPVGDASELVFAARSFDRERTLTARSGGTTIERTISQNWDTVTVPLHGETASFSVEPGCRIPAVTLSADDQRCLGIAVRDVRVR